MKYIYTIAATSIVFFIINVFIMLWYIVRKKNKDRKSIHCLSNSQYGLRLRKKEKIYITIIIFIFLFLSKFLFIKEMKNSALSYSFIKKYKKLKDKRIFL